MEKAEATYQYLEEAYGNGMFFYTSCCGNRMYSIDSDPMKYHGYLCPKCFWHNKLVTLYLRGTPDGIRVFETEHVVKADEGIKMKVVVIRNFEMPSACCCCDMCEYEYGERFICRITKHVIQGYSKYYNKRDLRCPLEEIKIEVNKEDQNESNVTMDEVYNK